MRVKRKQSVPMSQTFHLTNCCPELLADVIKWKHGTQRDISGLTSEIHHHHHLFPWQKQMLIPWLGQPPSGDRTMFWGWWVKVGLFCQKKQAKNSQTFVWSECPYLQLFNVPSSNTVRTTPFFVHCLPSPPPSWRNLTRALLQERQIRMWD